MSETRTKTSNFWTPGEGKIVRKLIKKLIGEGGLVSVYDGGETTVVRSGSVREVIKALATTGEDHLNVYGADGKWLGWFLLVYGNADDGEEVIANYTANEFCEKIYGEVQPS